MSTIYDPDAGTVNALTRTLFIVAIGLGIVGILRSATDGWVYGLLFFLLSGYTLYMRYWCERYTAFALSYFTLIIFLLALAPAWISYTVVTDDMEKSGTQGCVVACLLFSSIAALYAAIYFTPTRKFPFSVSRNKVSFTASSTSSLVGMVIAGPGTLVSGALIKSVTPFTIGILIVLLFLFGCIGTLIHARDLLRGIRTLRKREKNSGTPYTFMQIDEIRAVRSRWWLSRLFKWAASWRSSR
jgi:hypothetical protein